MSTTTVHPGDHHESSDVRIRPPKIHGQHQPDLIIKSDHSDETRILLHILGELQKSNRHVSRGEVWGMNVLCVQDGVPIHIDFTDRQRSLNLPAAIRNPDMPLRGLRIFNTGDGTFTGSGVLFYSVNMPTIEGGTVPLPVSTTAHSYRQRHNVYSSLNLRAISGDVNAVITVET